MAVETKDAFEKGDAFEKVAHEYNQIGRHLDIPNPYRAALFAYIGQFSFRGLTAWNEDGSLRSRAGTSQVGRYDHPSSRMTKLEAVSKKMQRVHVLNKDFNEVMQFIHHDAIVFMDPPYHGTLQTHNHPEHKFTMADQHDVMEWATRWATEGAAKVVCLNATDPELVAMFAERPDVFDLRYVSKNTYLKTGKNTDGRPHQVQYDFIATTFGHSGRDIRSEVNIVWRDVQELKPNDYNPNQLNSQQLTILSTSIRQNGMTMPIAIAPDNTIIDGEHRWRICQSLGHRRVPCVILDRDEAGKRLATLQFNLGRGQHDAEAEKNVLEDIFGMGGLDVLYETHLMPVSEIDELYDSWLEEMKPQAITPRVAGAPAPKLGGELRTRSDMGEDDLPDLVPVSFMVPRDMLVMVTATVNEMLEKK